MKLFFISDIHGSIFYLKKAIEAFHREKAQFIILLGDALYHGPRNPLPKYYNPKEVVELLNNYKDKIIAVRGNCDSEVDQMVLDYPMMSDYNIIMWANRRIFLTHGHIYNKEKLPKLSKGDVIVYGHSHVVNIEKADQVNIINLGSISLPKDETPHCYGILEGDRFTIKDLEENVYREIEFN